MKGAIGSLLLVTHVAAYHNFDGIIDLNPVDCTGTRQTSTGYLEYHYVKEQLSWMDALTRCPEIDPTWTGLATIRSYVDFRLMVDALQCGFTNPNIVPGTWGVDIGFYSGAWIGLYSATPIPDDVATHGPWPPGEDWYWIDGITLKKGKTLVPGPVQNKWGRRGTGWHGLAQPDNSGGRQRCGVISVGTNLPPVTGDTVFFDDQNCGPGDPIVNVNQFYCEKRVIMPPPPSPPPPVPPPPTPPPPSPPAG